MYFLACRATAFISSITRYEAPPALLKEIEDAESKIQAEVCLSDRICLQEVNAMTPN